MVIELLTLVIAGGGAGILIARLLEEWPWAMGLPPKWKRYLALALAALVGCLARVGLFWMARTWPIDAQAWVEALVAAGAAAAGVSQITHAQRWL